MSKNLSGKTALVTGAGGGLGRAIAEHFLTAGARVVACDINEALLADFTEKVSSAHPEATLVHKVDVTDEAALDALFAAAEAKFGPPDAIVNCAGVMDKFDAAGDLDEPMWDRVLAINTKAPTMITGRAVNLMLKHGIKGAIVNIASVAGFRGFASGVAYTVSKHGVIGLTKNTAAFYRSKGIRCNAIACGSMQTNISNDMLAKNLLNPEGLKIMGASLGLLATPDALVDLNKMAKLAAYLCSDDADIINGAVITADGGATAN